MKPKEEFIRQWEETLAALALFAITSETRDGLMVRASKILDIPDRVRKLLGQMHDDVTQAKPELPPGPATVPMRNGMAPAKKVEVNGHVPQTVPIRKV